MGAEQETGCGLESKRQDKRTRDPRSCQNDGDGLFARSNPEPLQTRTAASNLFGTSTGSLLVNCQRFLGGMLTYKTFDKSRTGCQSCGDPVAGYGLSKPSLSPSLAPFCYSIYIHWGETMT
ncbi:hypothetical protein J3458_017247 [Metarhizium acridum]|uniref:uncharacterized protein n=1 Tax=Metarhizium acridum TaxID=92637 RepID=UPI001C6BC2A7|nr:hypothetical protein J3458_017247 [Metarhizium acridum]